MKLFLLLSAFFLSFSFGNSEKVVAVLDGDTIIVINQDKQETRIRLFGIDCPEKSQDFGQKAKQFTSELCFQKMVVIQSHGIDKYGRTLGDVLLPGGKVLNQELVRVGLAWHYKHYSNDPLLAKLEVVAREKKLGLWSLNNPVAPWDYRHNK